MIEINRLSPLLFYCRNSVIAVALHLEVSSEYADPHAAASLPVPAASLPIADGFTFRFRGVVAPL